LEITGKIEPFAITKGAYFIDAKKIKNLHPIPTPRIAEILENPEEWKGKEVSMDGTFLTKKRCRDGYWVTMGYPEIKVHVPHGATIAKDYSYEKWLEELLPGHTIWIYGDVKFSNGESYIEASIFM
jgi:hypothetical protein